MEAMNSSRRRTLGNISETLEQYNHIQKGLIQISDFVSVHKSEVNYSVPVHVLDEARYGGDDDWIMW